MADPTLLTVSKRPEEGQEGSDMTATINQVERLEDRVERLEGLVLPTETTTDTLTRQAKRRDVIDTIFGAMRDAGYTPAQIAEALETLRTVQEASDG